MAKLTAHTGSHALRANIVEDRPVVERSCAVCALEDVSGLGDGDYEEVGEDDLNDVLSMLMELGQPDPKFLAFLSAIQNEDRAEAIRLLKEHDEETGENEVGSEEEVVDALLSEQRQAEDRV